jgi:branched-chain amino acid aminotransferase
MDRLIFHNNRILPVEDARLSPGQAGLLMGWGVFTTLRIYSGRPFAFDRHWLRMSRDSARLNVSLEYSQETVRQAVVELARANHCPESMARVLFIRNHIGVWSYAGATRPTDLLIFTSALPARPAAHRLWVERKALFSAGEYAGAKMLSWVPHAAVLEHAQAKGFHDALLLNEKGQIAECTSANAFLVRDGAVLTPPLASGCLAGVTRDILFEIASTSGIEIREQDLSLDDLVSGQEFFISSTTREVAGVSFIDPRWNYPVPGPVTQALDHAFRGHIRHWVESGDV